MGNKIESGGINGVVYKISGISNSKKRASSFMKNSTHSQDLGQVNFLISFEKQKLAIYK